MKSLLLEKLKIKFTFYAIFLQEHAIDSRVFQNVILLLHRTTYNIKSGAVFNSDFIGFKHPSAHFQPMSSGLRYFKSSSSIY